MTLLASTGETLPSDFTPIENYLYFAKDGEAWVIYRGDALWFANSDRHNTQADTLAGLQNKIKKQANINLYGSADATTL